MGAICSCFNVNDTPANEVRHHRNCECLNCSLWSIINRCRNFFGTQPRVAAPIINQANETRTQKVSSYSCPERARNLDANAMPKRSTEALIDSFEWNSDYASCYDRSSPSDDEDGCPTCFEEYTPENPKIVTECAHHYHLSCIYEWKERSDTCPVCGRILLIKDIN